MNDAINLADPRLGAAVISATDEFFGAKERLLQPTEPEWRAGVYDDHGKWMDGWETRRRRDAGHDHCLIRLAAACVISRVEIDTRYFTGNYPPFVSIESCCIEGDPHQASWQELLPKVALQGDHRVQFDIGSSRVCTHLRLNLYPDGGVARLRVYGRPHAVRTTQGSAPIDLAAALNGGIALCCSDEHYGSMQNLLLPGRGRSMADGWETRRRRQPGFDWVIIRLGQSGRVRAIEIDTAHFKGNFPHSVSLQAGGGSLGEVGDPASQALYWPTLLEQQLLGADRIHRFEREVAQLGPVEYVRLNIHPDGGLSRVRLLGIPEP